VRAAIPRTGYTPDSGIFPWRRFTHRIPLHFNVLWLMPRAGGRRTRLSDKRSRVIPVSRRTRLRYSHASCSERLAEVNAR
jgi:hypothetical protein